MSIDSKILFNQFEDARVSFLYAARTNKFVPADLASAHHEAWLQLAERKLDQEAEYMYHVIKAEARYQRLIVTCHQHRNDKPQN